MTPPQLILILHGRAHVRLELTVVVAIVEDVTKVRVGIVARRVERTLERRLELIGRQRQIAGSWIEQARDDLHHVRTRLKEILNGILGGHDGGNQRVSIVFDRRRRLFVVVLSVACIHRSAARRTTAAAAATIGSAS